MQLNAVLRHLIGKHLHWQALQINVVPLTLVIQCRNTAFNCKACHCELRAFKCRTTAFNCGAFAIIWTYMLPEQFCKVTNDLFIMFLEKNIRCFEENSSSDLEQLYGPDLSAGWIVVAFACVLPWSIVCGSQQSGGPPLLVDSHSALLFLFSCLLPHFVFQASSELHQVSIVATFNSKQDWENS